MRSREKQINEMAREMCHLSAECKTCQICNERYHGDDDLCYFQCVAKEIVNHGYRKQSEVVKEIFDAIKEKLIFNTYGIATISNKTFCELKKKYKGEKEDGALD